MATYIRRTIIVTSGPPRAPESDAGIHFNYDGDGPTLVFYRSPREEGCAPSDVVSLLKSEGVKTGILRPKFPAQS